MADEIVKSEPRPIGRPIAMTDEVVQKLIDVFRLGVNDTAACSYAGIGRTTFYEYYGKDEDFTNKIDTAKNFAVIAARQVIVKDIVDNKNIESAKWYLEKHDIKSTGVQQNTQVNVFNTLKEKYMIEEKPKVSVIKEDVLDGDTGLPEDN